MSESETDFSMADLLGFGFVSVMLDACDWLEWQADHLNDSLLLFSLGHAIDSS